MGLGLSLTLLAATVVSPSGIALERLADNMATPPGVSGEFFIDMPPPAPCGDSVLFNGFGDDGRAGVYSASPGALAVVANSGTLVPGSLETFKDAREQACSGDQVVFLGSGSDPPNRRRSVYTWRSGTITPLLDFGSVIGGSEVHSFNQLDGNEHGVGLVAALVPQALAQGVVLHIFGEQPVLIADTTTVLPGQVSPATIFSEPVLVGRDIVFHARTGTELGIYRWSVGGGLSVVVDTSTPVPLPGGGFFGLFNWIASIDYGIVFGGQFSGGFGIFASAAGQLYPLVVPGQATEDGELLVSAFFPSGAGRLLTFTGRTDDALFQDVIFVRTEDGAIQRVLGAGEEIEGRTVAFINARADASHVAIQVRSAGDPRNEVIYRATIGQTIGIPTLSAAGAVLFVLGLAAAALMMLQGQVLRPGCQHTEEGPVA